MASTKRGPKTNRQKNPAAQEQFKEHQKASRPKQVLDPETGEWRKHGASPQSLKQEPAQAEAPQVAEGKAEQVPVPHREA